MVTLAKKVREFFGRASSIGGGSSVFVIEVLVSDIGLFVLDA